MGGIGQPGGGQKRSAAKQPVPTQQRPDRVSSRYSRAICCEVGELEPGIHRRAVGEERVDDGVVHAQLLLSRLLLVAHLFGRLLVRPHEARRAHLQTGTVTGEGG